MKVVKVEYIRTIAPHMSCGTGFSKITVVKVTTDSGYECEIAVDDWYAPYDRGLEIFEDALRRKIPVRCSNLEEAYKMYRNAT